MAGGDRESVRLAVALQTALPGAPCTYYGDEIGLEGGRDPDNRHAFPPDEARWDRDLAAFVGAAFRLRGAESALRHGTIRVLGTAGPAIVLERGAVDDGSAWLIALDAGSDAVSVDIDAPALAGRLLRAVPMPGWPTPDDVRVADDGRARLAVAPRAGAFYRAT